MGHFSSKNIDAHLSYMNKKIPFNTVLNLSPNLHSSCTIRILRTYTVGLALNDTCLEWPLAVYSYISLSGSIFRV